MTAQELNITHSHPAVLVLRVICTMTTNALLMSIIINATGVLQY